MFSLSITSGYAVMALRCLEKAGEGWVSAPQISECSGIPQAYLSKILNSLGRSGLLEGRRGPKGGFRLLRHPQEISVWEVTEAIEAEGWLSRCILGLDTCEGKRPCPLHGFWVAKRAELEAALRAVSVEDMALSYEQAPGSPTEAMDLPA